MTAEAIVPLEIQSVERGQLAKRQLAVARFDALTLSGPHLVERAASLRRAFPQAEKTALEDVGTVHGGEDLEQRDLLGGPGQSVAPSIAPLGLHQALAGQGVQHFDEVGPGRAGAVRQDMAPAHPTFVARQADQRTGRVGCGDGWSEHGVHALAGNKR